MYNEYLRAFVIGSSFLIFAPFFFAVSRFDPKKTNFSYVPYTLLAPLGLGLMNVISLIIAKFFHLSSRMRYLVISILAPSYVTCMILFLKLYNYTKKEWLNHIWKLYLFYFIIVNFNLYLLDKYV
jgi:hypothetical protein